MSSCSVEQIFLRLVLVEYAVGKNMKNYMLELRIFYSVKGDIYELLDCIPMVTVS